MAANVCRHEMCDAFVADSNFQESWESLLEADIGTLSLVRRTRSQIYILHGDEGDRAVQLRQVRQSDYRSDGVRF
jgi:hypothetical protein